LKPKKRERKGINRLKRIKKRERKEKMLALSLF